MTNDTLDLLSIGQEAMDVLFNELTRCLHMLTGHGGGVNLPLINDNHGNPSHLGMGKTKDA